MVCRAREAGAESAKLGIRACMDNALRADGYSGIFNLERILQINPERSRRVGTATQEANQGGAWRVWDSTFSKRHLVNYFLWFAESWLGFREYCFALARYRLDNVCLLQNFKAGGVLARAVSPLGQFRFVS